MPRIHQLPGSVIAKIAAGEVIERPASVVKELLENSLDAGSTRIDIDIEQGGSDLIRIVDNGHGIHPDDMRLAFSNHATSKLKDADDLFAVRTMGFRGEALSSIAGIAQVTLQSRLHNPLTPNPSPPEGRGEKIAPLTLSPPEGRGENFGAEVSCQGSEFSPVRVWNGAAGTRIEVRNLFFNTPVRRKFLKTAATETGHICEIFTRIALARPGLHLTLRHNGKAVYEVAGSTSLLDRIGLFFGAEVTGKLYAIDAKQGSAHLFGYIADPSCERGNAKSQYLFLNGRWIRDRSLGHALQEGYRGLLMTGRYAVAFLFLDLPPDQVDVNVHPTKAEVRFRDASALYAFFLSSVRNRLNEENLVSRLQAPANQPTNGNGNGPAWFSPRPSDTTPSLFAQPGLPAFTKNPPTPPFSRNVEELSERADEPTHVVLPSSPETPAEPIAPRLPDDVINAIQLQNTYIVVETPEGMLVIDQHALHERILFEQIKERVREGHLEVQQMLIPEAVELSAEQASLLLDHRGELGELGLGVEDFGGNTVIITRYPALLGRRSPAEILKRVIDHLMNKERVPTREQLLSDLMSLMACHAAVRSGDALSPEEIAALVQMRHLAHDAHHCPHGRPTALLFTRHELDRQFRRV